MTDDHTTTAVDGAETEVLPIADQAPPSQGNATEKPRLAQGIDLIGEYEGSGFKETPFLARRADGQTLQLTALLYSVASHADGQCDEAAIAAAVSEDIGRKVSAAE